MYKKNMFNCLMKSIERNFQTEISCKMWDLSWNVKTGYHLGKWEEEKINTRCSGAVQRMVTLKK